RAALELSSAVERELGELRLIGARFVVAMEGGPVDLTGIDRVEFLLTTSAGEEPRPMARVASGGQLARFALALQTALSRAAARPQTRHARPSVSYSSAPPPRKRQPPLPLGEGRGEGAVRAETLLLVRHPHPRCARPLPEGEASC